MTKTEKAVARYIKTLNRRDRLLRDTEFAYARACDAAAAASTALGALDPELRTATYLAWKAEADAR